MNESWTNVTWWEEERSSRHRNRRAEAQFQLGVHYAARGDFAAAVAALLAVDPDDDRVVAARALVRLHRLYLALGQATEAWGALEMARDLSDARYSPDVELELGARAAALGQATAAGEHYRAVLAAFSPRERLGALAAFRLGHLRYEQGALTEALVLWRRALQGADEDLLPHVLMRLVDLLGQHARDGEVQAIYQRVIATDHPDLAPQAALALGQHYEQRGSHSLALSLYALAISSEHPDVVGIAQTRRKALLQRRAREVAKEVHRSARSMPVGVDPAAADHRGRGSNSVGRVRRTIRRFTKTCPGLRSRPDHADRTLDSATGCRLCAYHHGAPDEPWDGESRHVLLDPDCGVGVMYFVVPSVRSAMDGVPATSVGGEECSFVNEAHQSPLIGASGLARGGSDLHPAHDWMGLSTPLMPHIINRRSGAELHLGGQDRDAGALCGCVPTLSEGSRLSGAVLLCQAHAAALSLERRDGASGDALNWLLRDEFHLRVGEPNIAGPGAVAWPALFEGCWSHRDQ